MKANPIAAKLGAAFGLLILILVGIGWFGLTRMSLINANLDEMFTRRWAKVELAREAIFSANYNYRITSDLFFLEHPNKDEVRVLLQQRTANSLQVSSLVTQISAMVESEQEKRLLNAVVDSRARSLGGVRDAVALLMDQNKPDEAKRLMLTVARPHIDAYHDSWATFLQYETDQMRVARDRSQASYNQARRVATLLIVLASCMAAFIGFLVTHKMLQEIDVREKTQAKVSELNAELEERVTARTQELAQALENLETETSQRKHNENELRQAQKMEAIGRLAGGVAHDFNNMLGVIIGYSELLLDQLPGNTPLHKHTEQIKKAGERASELTRQLLAFSRQQVLESKVLNLNAVISELGKMLPRLLGEDIAILSSLSPDLGRVKADPSQIEQIVLNLAVNARDSMPAGGKLMLETRNIDLDEEYAERHPPLSAGRYVVLSVTDTGIGMDEQTQSRIFEPFFTTKEMGKGTGLGLATVYGVIKQSNGYIWVYSEPGVGSTFKVYLPRVDQLADENGAGNQALPHPPLRTETILLVEDEESLRNLTRTFLNKRGCIVLDAKNGAEAIDVARKYCNRIDILLTDMVMPGMNGRVLAEHLTRNRPEMRVLFMSGYAGFTDTGFLSTGNILLSKPFTREALFQKLDEVLAVVPTTAEV